MSDLGYTDATSSASTAAFQTGPVTTDTNTQVTGAASTSSSSAEGGGGGEGSTTFSSMGDFKARYPTVYNQMMLGISSTMVNEMQHRQDRLKELWREARQKSEAA